MKKKKNEIDIFQVDTTGAVTLPYADEGIQAGFPSPAQDYIDMSINLNDVLIRNKSTTFCGRVRGDSLFDDDIRDGDLLVIDKSLEPLQGDLAVCCIDGDFTLKYIDIRAKEIWLIPANKDFQPIHVTEDNDFMIWGIVTYSIKKHRTNREKRGR